MTPNCELKALIFDVDGTLAETEIAGHLRAFNETFKRFHLPWYWDVELYCELLKIGGGKERLHHYIEHHLPAAEQPKEAEKLIRELHAAKTNTYTELASSGAILLRPGIARLIEEALTSGLSLGIATTTSRPAVESLLKATLGNKGPSLFKSIVAGDEVPAKKPAPDVYLKAIEQLALKNPENTAFAFEDTDIGTRSAIAAGLRVIVTVNGITRKEDFSGAMIVLESLGEPDQPTSKLISAYSLDLDSRRYLHLDLLRHWLQNCCDLSSS